jgi:molybdopterin molybdotransferase
MISIEEALGIVCSRAEAAVSHGLMPIEEVDLEEACGRVLRGPVPADLDAPPFDRSIRDGFAVRSQDVGETPVVLRIVGESRAGAAFAGRVGPGECSEIMTGAEVPDGADAVVMVEDTERADDNGVRILKTVPRGRSIQTRGSECRRGDLILDPGRLIGAPEAAVLATTGHARVSVSKKPIVGILSTGDELVEVGSIPGPSQIRNSNSITLAAQVVEAGGLPRMLGIVRDDPGALADALGGGLASDVLITSGGVSMGKYDLVVGGLESHGVEIGFDKVAMKPGKPTVFGWRADRFVFGLPGNPVSTIVAFQLFVRPLIRTLLRLAAPQTVLLEATLESGARCDPARAACVPASVRFEGGRYRLALVPWKGSSDLAGLAKANAYVMIPKQDGVLGAGSLVRFIPMAGTTSAA